MQKYFHAEEHTTTGLLSCASRGALQPAPALRGHRRHLSCRRPGRVGNRRGRHRPDHGLCDDEPVLGHQCRRYRSCLAIVGRGAQGRGRAGRVSGDAACRRGGRTHHAARAFLRRTNGSASRRGARGARDHRRLYPDHLHLHCIHDLHQCYLRHHARHRGYQDASLFDAAGEHSPRRGGVSAYLRTSRPARAWRERGRDRRGDLREHGRGIPVRALPAQTVYNHNEARGDKADPDDDQARASDPCRQAAPERRFPGICKDHPALRHGRVRGAPGRAGDRGVFLHAGVRYCRGRRHHGRSESRGRQACGRAAFRL